MELELLPLHVLSVTTCFNVVLNVCVVLNGVGSRLLCAGSLSLSLTRLLEPGREGTRLPVRGSCPGAEPPGRRAPAALGQSHLAPKKELRG